MEMVMSWVSMPVVNEDENFSKDSFLSNIFIQESDTLEWSA